MELSGPKVRIVLLSQWILGQTARIHPGRHSSAVFRGPTLSNRLLARALTALIVLNVGSPAQAQRAVDQDIVIENVTLISPERVGPLLHADVIIRNGTIAEIGTRL